MTNTNANKANTQKSTTRRKQSSTQKQAPDMATNDKPKYIVRQTIDPNAIIPVTNGFQGLLVCRNRRTNETFIFEEFGDTQDMTFGDLKSIKASDKAFFENNWLLFDDPEILDALDVTKYYKKSLSLRGFDNLFDKKPDEVKRIVSGLSKAQRRSVAYKARNMIIEKRLDSLGLIDALEESLGIKLLER